MQERMENIEIRCLYLEKTVDELNSVVIEQQKEIRELRHLVTLLATRCMAVPAASQDPDEKPPHY
jgi:SlyX protein